jgi:hypothetical protein
LGYDEARPASAWAWGEMIVFFALLLLIFGLWACAWGVWACFNRPRPHDLLGGVTALVGVTALGLGAALLLQPGFLG